MHVFVPSLNHADSIGDDAEHELRDRTTQRVANEAATHLAHRSGIGHRADACARSWPASSPSGSRGRSASRSTICDPGCSAVADGDLDYKLEIPAEPIGRVRPARGKLSRDDPAAGRARQAEGGVRLGRIARAQDADQRHHRLSAAARRRRLRTAHREAAWTCTKRWPCRPTRCCGS